ncbi:MAG: RNA polymerase-binding protein DksA [Burkholderiaceae bacterium]|nr:RNA polymerase-binding protein DksA [Rhodoferax sp.]
MKATPAKAKTAAKTPVKAAKPAAKAAAKPAAKPAATKAAPRPTAKKATTHAAGKSTTSKRPAAKTAPAPAVKQAAATKATATKSTMSTKTTEASKSAPKSENTRAMPPTTVMSASGVPQRTGRPSSRLASLTVPSMAQSVASTAAKASYTPLPDTPVIIPPLASAARKDPKLANNWKTKPAEELTNAELLAMPDTEYMNEKQMAAFRFKLTMLKRDILASAGETTEHLREDTVVVPDPADRATIEEEHALELRTRDRERKLLKKIEQSIARIDAGDYGYCDETGEPIGVGRLLARPTATLSLEAQQRRELKQKMFGD